LRAFAYFFYRYVLRLGLPDGQAGTAFHLLQGFWYRYLVDAKVAEVFEDPAVMSCYGNLEYVREAKGGNEAVPPSGLDVVRHWRSRPFDRDRFKWGWMPHPTFFVRQSVYERFGLFRLDLGSAADYELMLRLLFRHRITAAYPPQERHPRQHEISRCASK